MIVYPHTTAAEERLAATVHLGPRFYRWTDHTVEGPLYYIPADQLQDQPAIPGCEYWPRASVLDLRPCWDQRPEVLDAGH